MEQAVAAHADNDRHGFSSGMCCGRSGSRHERSRCSGGRLRYDPGAVAPIRASPILKTSVSPTAMSRRCANSSRAVPYILRTVHISSSRWQGARGCTPVRSVLRALCARQRTHRATIFYDPDTVTAEVQRQKVLLHRPFPCRASRLGKRAAGSHLHRGLHAAALRCSSRCWRATRRSRARASCWTSPQSRSSCGRAMSRGEQMVTEWRAYPRACEKRGRLQRATLSRTG